MTRDSRPWCLSRGETRDTRVANFYNAVLEVSYTRGVHVHGKISRDMVHMVMQEGSAHILQCYEDCPRRNRFFLFKSTKQLVW